MRLARSAVLLAAALLAFVAGCLAQKVLEPGFVMVPAWEKLANPTGVRFAPDGRVFIIGKGGVIYTAKSVEDRNPVVAADISGITFNNFDKGLVGLAPHPDWNAGKKVVYLLYSRDGEVGGPTPVYSDLCPSGICFTSGALSRMAWNADLEKLENLEEIIVDWCSGSTTHAQGDLRFDSAKNLIMSVGDNSFLPGDSMNLGAAPNKCPYANGGAANPEFGGVMMSQAMDSYLGKVLYAPVATLDAFKPGMPTPKLQVLARGFRNPYRFVVDPATDNLYLGDVGFADWEEINLIPSVRATGGNGANNNYGWPCLEGVMHSATVEAQNFPTCNELYTNPSKSKQALFKYSHFGQFGNVVTKAGGQSAITGIAVYSGASSFPADYKDALFFADYTRGGFWGVRRNATGLDFDKARMMIGDTTQIVDITKGPDGALYISQIWAGTVWRFQAASKELPVVKVAADKTSGTVPLTVKFDSAGSYDTLGGGALTFAWDLDGSGKFAGPNTATATYTYATAKPVTVSLRVTSTSGAVNTGSTLDNGGSASGIAVSKKDYEFNVGDSLTATATVTSQDGVAIPEANYSWEVLISHCYPGPPCRPNDISCHQHLVNTYAGAKAITFVAPDHEYPSQLTINLNVKHPTTPGLVIPYTTRVTPNVVNAQVTTDPPGLSVLLNLAPFKTPTVFPTLSGGEISVDLYTEQLIDRQAYRFASWSQGGAARQALRPVNGTVYTAKFTPFTIGNYAAGQGPSAPTGLVITPEYQKCTLNWAAPAMQDPAAAVKSYIVYHREIKFGATVPPFSSGMVPVTSTTYSINVDVGSQCEFYVSAVTSVGESSFKAAPVAAYSLAVPAIGSDTCPDTTCRYKALVVDDFNHATSPKSLLGLLQEGEFLTRFEIVNNKLVSQAQSANTYWYSLLGNTVQCFDASQFTHLSFKVTAPRGFEYSVGMDSKDANCAAYVPKKTVKVHLYTPEKVFTGAEQDVLIPLADISNNPASAFSIFFNGYSSFTDQVVMDDLAIVNRCNNLPPTTTTTTGPVNPTGTPGQCTAPPLPVDAFTNPDSNALGVWSGTEGLVRNYANNVMTAKATAAGAYFATLLGGQACRDLTVYSAVTFSIRQITTGTAAAFPTLQLQGRNAACTARDPAQSATVAIAQYVKDGVATVPLSAFAANVDLKRGHALVIGDWPLNVEFAVGEIRLACAAGATPTGTATTTPAPTQTGGATCPPLVVDTFAQAGQNSLQLWAGSELANAAYAGNAMTVTATAAGAYFASNIAGASCRDLSAYSALQFNIAPTTANAQVTYPTLELQQRTAACTARDPAASFKVALGPYVKDGVATVPLTAFAGANIKLGHALALVNWQVNTPFRLSQMQFMCGAGTTPTTTATAGPTTATPTATGTPGTCTAPLVIDTFAQAGANALGGLWTGGEGATIAYPGGNKVTLRTTTPAASYFAEVLAGATCRDISSFAALSFGITASAAGAALPGLELQLRNADCTARAPDATFRVALTGYVANGVATVPLAAFAGADLKRAHAVVLSGFGANVDWTLTNLQLVCGANPPATTATATPTATATATATTTPVPTGTCTKLAVESFTSNADQNALNQWAGGEPATAIARSAGRLTVTATATNGVYYASTLSTAAQCRDVSPYTHLAFTVRGPAGGKFNLEMQALAATAAAGTCQSSPMSALNRFVVPVTPAGMGPAKPVRVKVPLASFTGMAANRVHAYSFGDFAAGSYGFEAVELVSAACA
ncbi:hypothetical protein H9P43_009575 [Blastocladiella emersonii ATCC 22665]|nr:hypothetical protein H9P43_009575 [Blastocladiella emersonii ATCC 22665]